MEQGVVRARWRRKSLKTFGAVPLPISTLALHCDNVHCSHEPQHSFLTETLHANTQTTVNLITLPMAITVWTAGCTVSGWDTRSFNTALDMSCFKPETSLTRPGTTEVSGISRSILFARLHNVPLHRYVIERVPCDCRTGKRRSGSAQ